MSIAEVAWDLVVPRFEWKGGWDFDHTIRNLNQLDKSRIDELGVLGPNTPYHGHYFPEQVDEPEWLRTRVTNIMSGVDLKSLKFPFTSSVYEDAARIAQLYSQYFKEQGISGNTSVSTPEEQQNYPFQITVGKPTGDPNKIIEHFPWIDYLFGIYLYDGSRLAVSQSTIINTTRDEGRFYNVAVVKRGGDVENRYETMGGKNKVDFRVDKSGRRLMTYLMAARTPALKPAA